MCLLLLQWEDERVVDVLVCVVCGAQVRADKQREVRDGHDGTWVAHPALVPIAKQIFDAGMSSPNQVTIRRLLVT